MKDSLYAWRKGWFYALMVLLAIPTLGYTWLVMVSTLLFTEKHWQMHAVTALEGWLHFWRGILLVLAGFPTLGFTWTLFKKWDEPLLLSLHVKYADYPAKEAE